MKPRHPLRFAHDRTYRAGGALLADITSPSNNASFTPSTSISVTANASDADGTISQVQFFDTGNNLLGSITQAPYSFTMSGLAIGSYGIYAIATDNSNATASSGTILFSVVNAQTLPVFYIQTDQLNTPRLITNGNNTPVWRWDNLDPFADNIPNDDPANTGNHFTFNQRFPGQYFDKETSTNYNYFRDYDPATGRYLESDPIGLEGGINTYGYVNGNPLMFVDPTGENAAGATIGGRVGAGLGGIVGELIDPLGGGVPGARIGGAIGSVLGDLVTGSDAGTQRQSEYLHAKNFCDSPPEGSDCASLSRKIEHAEKCIDLYEAWDNKWMPGRHSDKLQNWRNRLNNLKEEHRKKCTNKCP